LKNIAAKVGAAEETVFCNNCADIVFYSMVLHDFDNAAKVLQNAKQMIRPAGRLIDLDWKKKKMSLGPPARIRFTEKIASSLIKAAGFDIESVEDAGLYHYVVTAKPSL
jgi:ubiquinone/menaquinone biosynthesis C-methylase UbiE